jgi:hypothetical protein
VKAFFARLAEIDEQRAQSAKPYREFLGGYYFAGTQ